MPTQYVDKELETQAVAWPARARQIVVIDAQSYKGAGELLVSISILEKQIIDHHKPIKDAAHAAHKAAVAAEKRLLDPLTDAKCILKRSISAWEVEQERIRQEQERKMREEQAAKEAEMRLGIAVQAEEMGAPEEVIEEIMDRPLPLPEPVAERTFERIGGVGTQERWHAEITSMLELCSAIARGDVPMIYVEPNMTALNARARAEKDVMKIPGVKAVKETTVTVRRK